MTIDWSSVGAPYHRPRRRSHQRIAGRTATTLSQNCGAACRSVMVSRSSDSFQQLCISSMRGLLTLLSPRFESTADRSYRGRGERQGPLVFGRCHRSSCSGRTSGRTKGVDAEPDDHMFGRPCWRLFAKFYLRSNRKNHPPNLLLTAGQAQESPCLLDLLEGAVARGIDDRNRMRMLQRAVDSG